MAFIFIFFSSSFENKTQILMVSNLSLFFFYETSFLCPNKSLLNSRSQMFSSTNSVGLHITFESIIRFVLSLHLTNLGSGLFF